MDKIARRDGYLALIGAIVLLLGMLLGPSPAGSNVGLEADAAQTGIPVPRPSTRSSKVMIRWPVLAG